MSRICYLLVAMLIALAAGIGLFIAAKRLQAPPPMLHYSSPALGFAVEYPSDWRASYLGGGPCTGDPGRVCDAVLFQTSDAFSNYYGVTVFRYWPAMGETITDTVEYDLRNLTPRDQIKQRCCLTVAGKPAMELIFPPLPEERSRNRQLAAIHSGGEYVLVFWSNVPFQPGGVFDLPQDSEVQRAFDAFLQAFTFIPITETPTPPPPALTPAPTPTRGPTPVNPTS